MTIHLSAANLHTIVCTGNLLPTTPTPLCGNRNWPQLLEALLIGSHPQTSFNLVDQCAKDQRLHHLRERWADDILWYKPDTVVVMCGVSDAYYILQDWPEKMNAVEWESTLVRLITSHRDQLPNTHFVFLEPFLHTLSPIKEAESIKAYQSALAKVCTTMECTFVPLADTLQDHIRRHGEWSLGTSLEPNLDAQLIIANAAFAALAPKAPRPCPKVDRRLTLCVGDSITDAERRNAAWSPLGGGYVRVLNALWQTRSKNTPLIRNEGIGGNTVVDLQERWDRDVLAHAPARLTIKIGINDVNHALSNSPQAVPLPRFRQAYWDIMNRTRSALPDCSILLIQPFYLSRMQDPDSYRTKVLTSLKQYQECVREIAHEFNCPVLETHELFQNLLPHYHQSHLANEPVHIHLTGHVILAQALLGLIEKTIVS